jgi:hypothetical protein
VPGWTTVVRLLTAADTQTATRRIPRITRDDNLSAISSTGESRLFTGRPSVLRPRPIRGFWRGRISTISSSSPMIWTSRAILAAGADDLPSGVQIRTQDLLSDGAINIVAKGTRSASSDRSFSACRDSLRRSSAPASARTTATATSRISTVRTDSSPAPPGTARPPAHTRLTPIARARRR